MKNLWVRVRQWFLRRWRRLRGISEGDGRLNLPPITPQESMWRVEYSDNGVWRDAYTGTSGIQSRIAFANLRGGKFKARCWENDILRGEC